MYTDFSMAFDIVNQDVLVPQLEKYGISGPLLAQIIRISGLMSREIRIPCGVRRTVTCYAAIRSCLVDRLVPQ